MAEPSANDNYVVVGEYLVAENDADEEVDAEWAGCANARRRSAVSRAYYAVLLRLKYRLVPVRRWTGGFPDFDIHASIRKAVTDQLGRHHMLTVNLSELAENRGVADYDWRDTVNSEAAEDALDRARESLTLVEGLTRDQLEGIALAVEQYHAQARERRSRR